MRLQSHARSALRAMRRDAAPRMLRAVGEEAARRAREKCPVAPGPLGGTLKKSIGYRVEGNTLRVGSRAPYAPYVELGTRSARAQPFLQSAILQGRAELERAAKGAARR